MTNLKATHATIFCKTHWKKVPMIAWEMSLFNGCAHTHTHTHTHTSYTQREIFNHALEGKNSSKGLNFKKKWRKNTKSTHRKDQGSMPGQTWIFPGLFFNRLGCLFNCENHLFPLSVHITLFNVFWYNIIHFIRASFLNRSTIKTGFP